VPVYRRRGDWTPVATSSRRLDSIAASVRFYRRRGELAATGKQNCGRRGELAATGLGRETQ